MYTKIEVAVQFQRGDMLALKLLVHTKERGAHRIPYFLSTFFFFTLKIILAPPNAPLDVEIGLLCR
jgi:hypothetical protein